VPILSATPRLFPKFGACGSVICFTVWPSGTSSWLPLPTQQDTPNSSSPSASQMPLLPALALPNYYWPNTGGNYSVLTNRWLPFINCARLICRALFSPLSSALNCPGRTTTLLNLAAVLAQDFQQNVLCLDTQTLPTSRLGCWTLPAWREADVPPDDWVYRADFHRQLLTVAERFTLAGYWGGQDECWRETLRNETAAFDLVLIECHQLSSENEMDSLLLADLVLLAAGLRADELSAAFPLTTYASLSRFQARTPPPIKLLFQQRPQAAQLRQFYQAQGADFLTQEIVSDQAYQAALQAGQPVVHCAPQSAATRSYRAVAEEILRLLYCP
jgi:cellulose biosynthesis protein BcsQ